MTKKTDKRFLKSPTHKDERKPIYSCTGCGRTCTDPAADLEGLKASGHVGCCPERDMQAVVMLPERFLDVLEFRHCIGVPDNVRLLGPCWLWHGRKNRNGYGRVRWMGKEPVAHRVVYELTHGPVADGLLLDHKCRVRNCCSPFHAEPVTPKTNTNRGEAVLFKKAYAYALENGRL